MVSVSEPGDPSLILGKFGHAASHAGGAADHEAAWVIGSTRHSISDGIGRALLAHRRETRQLGKRTFATHFVVSAVLPLTVRLSVPTI